MSIWEPIPPAGYVTLGCVAVPHLADPRSVGSIIGQRYLSTYPTGTSTNTGTGTEEWLPSSSSSSSSSCVCVRADLAYEAGLVMIGDGEGAMARAYRSGGGGDGPRGGPRGHPPTTRVLPTTTPRPVWVGTSTDASRWQVTMWGVDNEGGTFVVTPVQDDGTMMVPRWRFGCVGEVDERR